MRRLKALIKKLHSVLQLPGDSLSGRGDVALENSDTTTGATAPVDDAQMRRILATTNAITNAEVSLSATERAEHKESVKRFLNTSVRQSWTWDWPQPEGVHEERLHIPQTVNEDVLALPDEEWKERDEWESDYSASESDTLKSKDGLQDTLQSNLSGTKTPSSQHGIRARQASLNILKAKRKYRRYERLTEEASWNNGLNCFLQRQQAWTCARYAPSSPSEPIPLLPMSTTVIDFAPQHPTSPLPIPLYNSTPPAQEAAGGPSQPFSSPTTPTTLTPAPTTLAPLQIPTCPPLTPILTRLRSPITPENYTTIYTKIVSLGATPNFPLNLADVVRACVKGWKMNGEWPPQSSFTGEALRKQKRTRGLVEELFGGEKRDDRVGRDAGVAGEGEGEGQGEMVKRSEEDGKKGRVKRGMRKFLGLEGELDAFSK